MSLCRLQVRVGYASRRLYHTRAIWATETVRLTEEPLRDMKVEAAYLVSATAKVDSLSSQTSGFISEVL